MVKKPGWPKRRDLVMIKVIKVNPFSALVSLEEYDKKEGMVHISEVARKWIKDIRKFVKMGQIKVALVLYVDREKGHITLSIKKVSKYDANEKMKVYKREQKAEKMLKQVANELKIDLKEAYKEIGFKLQEEFGEIFKGFQEALEGKDALIEAGIPEKYAKVIKAIADKQMEIKEKTIKGELELRCFESNGIEIIKKILEDMEKKYKININYVSAPSYSLSLRTKDAKAGERKIKEMAEKIISQINSFGGEGEFKN